jgi:hypothetical protein
MQPLGFRFDEDAVLLDGTAHCVSGELRQRAEDQTAEWQDALEHTSDKARRQMGRRNIRAQRTPEALKGLSDEIRKQKTQLGPPARKAAVPRANRRRRVAPGDGRRAQRRHGPRACRRLPRCARRATRQIE